MAVKICRVCFEEGDDLENLGSGSNSYGHKLASCIPEIDVYIVCNPSICSTCLPMVEVAYALREMCIENERKFRTKKINVITGTCEVRESTGNSEVSSKITNGEVISETVIAGRVNDSDNNQFHVSVVFNNCFNESHVTPVTFKEEISLNDNFGSPKSDCATKLEEGSKNKNLHETNKSEDELINSLNEMCADLKNFEETPCTNNAETSDQLFSDDDSDDSFELDLDSLNLFNENEMNESEEKYKNEWTKVQEANLNKSSKIVLCKICKEMHDEDYINTHMKTHDVRSTYDCGRCDETFSDTCELETHNLTHLKNLCDVCGNVFKSKNDLVEHKRTHVTVCCGEQFSTGSLLQLHTYQKHGKTCGICKKTSDSFNALFLHLLEHMGEDKLCCRKCKKTFLSDVLKLNHQCESQDRNEACKIIFEETELDEYNFKGYFTCNRCAASFALKFELENHLSEKHGPIKQFTTDKSDLNVPEIPANVLNYNCEQNTGTDSMERQLCPCQLCPSKFKSHSLLTQHLLKNHCVKTPSIELVDYQKCISGLNLVNDPSQHSEAPIRLHCYACREVYMNVSLYLKHMKLFHSKCTVCKLRLNDVRNVIEHVKRHFKKKKNSSLEKDHKEISPKRDNQLLQTHLSVKSEKPFCELCQKEFVDELYYSMHMAKFHKKGFRYSTKLYSCKICYDVFDTKLELKAHAEEHYVCVHCNKTFALKSNLQQHMNFYHVSSSKSSARVALNQEQMAPDHRLTSETQASICSVPQKQTLGLHRKCKTCGEDFSNTTFLMKHIYAVHSRCTIECDTGNGSDDENMMMQNDPPAQSASRCDICQEHFDTVDKLKAHVSVHI